MGTTSDVYVLRRLAALAVLGLVFFLGDAGAPHPSGSVVGFISSAQAQTPSMRRRVIKPSTKRKLLRKKRLKDKKETTTAEEPTTTSRPTQKKKPRVTKTARPKVLLPPHAPPGRKPKSPKAAVADSDLLPPGVRDQIARTPTQAFELTDQSAPRFVDREVLVSFTGRAPQSLIDALAQQFNLTPLDNVFVEMAGVDTHRFGIPDNRPVADIIGLVLADGRAAQVQANFIFVLQGDTTTAAAKDAQAGLQYALGKLRVQTAHQRATGETIKIAVIDTQVDATHPELDGAGLEAFDATGTESAGPDAHGTAITGIIASQKTLRGVAPQAQILAIRAFRRVEGSPLGEADTMSLMRALHWAEQHGARVLNMSFAGPEDEMLSTLLDAAHDKGIIMVAASGNAGPDAAPLYPAVHEHVIAVTATDWTDKLYRMANRGNHIALAAPGVDILVVVPDGKFAMMSGTSLATAHISGMIALLLERNPDLKPEEILALITQSAVDLGPDGTDPQFGAGLADAVSALDANAMVSASE